MIVPMKPTNCSYVVLQGILHMKFGVFSARFCIGIVEEARVVFHVFAFWFCMGFPDETRFVFLRFLFFFMHLVFAR